MRHDPLAPSLAPRPVDLAGYGFAPALCVAMPLSGPPVVTWRAPGLLDSAGAVYAALRDDGLPLAVGAARDRLGRRWDAILRGVAGEAGLHPGHAGADWDPGCWMLAVRGRRFQVWARPSLLAARRGRLEEEAKALSALLCPGLGTSAGQQRGVNVARRPAVI